MKFKAYSSALLALCFILVMTACSSNSGPTQGTNGSDGSKGNEKVTLKMWYWNGAISDSTIEAAKAKFPNITLQAEKLPSGDDYLTKLRTTLAGGGTGPDIVAMDAWISSMITYKDKFVNLYDQGAHDIESKYLDWKWKMATDAENKYLIGLPIDVAPVVLYYRTDLFQQAGVPSTPEAIRNEVKTYEDYLSLLKKVNEATGTKTGTIADVFGFLLGQSLRSSSTRTATILATRQLSRKPGTELSKRFRKV